MFSWRLKFMWELLFGALKSDTLKSKQKEKIDLTKGTLFQYLTAVCWDSKVSRKMLKSRARLKNLGLEIRNENARASQYIKAQAKFANGFSNFEFKPSAVRFPPISLCLQICSFIVEIVAE